MSEPENRPLPNAALRTLLRAIEDVMGTPGLKAVLNLGGLQKYINNFPPNNLEEQVTQYDYGAAQQAVENFYGGRGARAMLTQIGRTTFRYSLEEQPAILGIVGLALRLLPEAARLKLILSRLADAGTKRLHMDVTVEEDDNAYYLLYGNCPGLFREREENNLCCFTTVGVVQEATKFATNGKHFRIQQDRCKRVGDEQCRFCVFKQVVE